MTTKRRHARDVIAVEGLEGNAVVVSGADGKPVPVTLDGAPVPVFLHGHPTNHPLPIHGNVGILGQPVQVADALGQRPVLVHVLDTGEDRVDLPRAGASAIALERAFDPPVQLLWLQLHVTGLAYYTIEFNGHVWRSGYASGTRDISLATRERVQGCITVRLRALEAAAGAYASLTWHE